MKNSDEIPSLASQLLALAVLLLLLLVAVGMSMLPLGPAGALPTTAIAVAQAGVVMAVFMRLRNASATLRMIAVISFAWPMLIVAFTLGDYMTRSALHWPW